MNDEEILLKIQREYTENEKINLLIKYINELKKNVSQLKIEKGILISELSEANDLLSDLQLTMTDEEKKTLKKKWSKDDLIKELKKEILEEKEKFTQLQKKHTLTKKDLLDWQTKFFQLKTKELQMQQQ